MAMRSWLFVPGDSQPKLDKAAGLGADVVIVDLEDAVAPPAKPQARLLTNSWLLRHAGSTFGRWVRINPLDTPLWREDVAAVMPARPDGIMVPKAAGPEQLQALSGELVVQEQRHGVVPGSTRILPLVSETPAAALGIAAYAGAALPRLAGLTWGAEDLSVALARGIMAIDTLHAEFRDLDGLGRVALESYADGFTGMLAIHPSQVPVINAAFTPSEVEIAEAQAIVNAFSANPGVGALSLDGRMLDQPHLEQARRLLERLA